MEVVILDPHGRKDNIKPTISAVTGKEGTFLVEYTPVDQGVHTVNIFFAGNAIPKSPYTVQVSPRKYHGFFGVGGGGGVGREGRGVVGAMLNDTRDGSIRVAGTHCLLPS